MANLFDSSIKIEIYNTLIKWGCSDAVASILDGIIILLYITLFIALINISLRWGVMGTIHWLVKKTHVWWDDLLFDRKVMRHLCGIVTPIVINLTLPLLISSLDISREWFIDILYKGIDIYVIIACLIFINTLFKTLFAIIEHRPTWKGKPIKGLLETLQVVLVIIGGILIIAVIIDKSPTGLLAGLGASAAVISFIFKDSLMGLVAGVQLSANNMLKVGDWIEMPSRGIDGVVVAVSLTTIKIRSWNNTLQTIPPYLLISEPFDNWQAMRDSGGRRIKRNINIDMSSLRFADEAFIESLRTNEATAEIMKSIATSLEEGGVVTNLDIYMRYINRYLDTHPRLNHTMTCMVRQLQPTEWGLPIELYCFSANVNWVPYEHLQAEIFSHIVALAPLFSIEIYQAPAGSSFRK
ncbi:MAG: mechanosensitive ion channel [Alistipes sp.]|nr:mechanosensitive ion channel [Alistipes sp.]